jgi:hypothetical protein
LKSETPKKYSVTPAFFCENKIQCNNPQPFASLLQNSPMKPFFLLFLLPINLFAQSDSIDEDQILQKIELGDPSIRLEDIFLAQPAVPISHLQRKGCIYYLDSLYSGVILEPIYDSLYMLWGCKDGYLTGEKMIRQRFHRDTAFCTVYYSQEAALGEVMIVDFTRYYANGRVEETGRAYKEDCLGYESYFGGQAIFGSGDADGKFRHYYENGQLESSYTKCAGNFDGEYLEYHANGKVKERRFYMLGIPKETWRQYSEKGKRTGKLKFKTGRPTGRWNGEKVSKSEF